MKVIDSDQINNTDGFEANANKVINEREWSGVGGRFAEMHPSSHTCVNRSLLGNRLDVYLVYER